MSRLLFICSKGGEAFLPEIVKYASGFIETSTCYCSNLSELAAAAASADIIWLEWADAVTVELSNRGLLDGKKVILRIHSYEAFSNAIMMIKWDKIEDLIFVAPHIAEICFSRNPEIQKNVKAVHIIPNGVNLEKFRFSEHRPGREIAFLGTVNYKKGPMLLFHAFNELISCGGDYNLHIGGVIEDMRFYFYYSQMAEELGIKDRIFFENRINDVPDWLKDKNYIVTSSVLESQQMAIMEAMACGVKPLIHNFVGARKVYPDHLIWNTIHDFVKMVQENSYDSASYRKYIRANYSLDKQMSAIRQLICPE